ncbi:hypothetical protein PPL_04566 [Heterostelium album PN500]|uniref:N-lysine methyltransferase n=1 Tax=Heterostelium pallidum (strain ATCC 26659 / Pp 5 / PN500) TaxID=670386 RepID=D3B7X8_HETP5|nr:hypothetical protein PPL_04566 [Heterostelium album PN500]EFA82146.1 hypothetical protein PPL_04566 [Heterostelium album PN500]|eukprot:XP_020434263.1 hypothetical protein PPL_04566 [Heterostelium album PN500]
MSNNQLSLREQLDIVVKWLDDNGVKINHKLIEIVCQKQSVDDVTNKNTPHEQVVEGLGVIALQDLKIDHTVAIIPKSCLLTPHTTSISAYLKKYKIKDATATSIALLYEASIGSQSKWYGYIKSLPLSVDLPILWNDADLKNLKGTSIETVVYENKETVDATYNKYIKSKLIANHPDVFNEHVFSLDNFKRASCLVSSRAFNIDTYHGDSMVPLADIFNHRTGRENVHIESDENDDLCSKCGSSSSCKHRKRSREDDHHHHGHKHDENCNHDHEEDEEDEEEDDDEQVQVDDLDYLANIKVPKDSLFIRVVREVSKGCEVYNTYGDHDNSLLLSKYGFVELDNPCDLVRVEPDLIDRVLESHSGLEPAEIKDRLAFYCQLFEAESRDHHAFESSGAADDALVCSIYLAMLQTAQYQQLKKTKLSMIYKQLDKLEAKQMVRSNKRVGEFIITVIEERLKLFPTTNLDIKQEIANLSSITDQRLFNSTSLQIAEKQLLLNSKNGNLIWVKDL